MKTRDLIALLKDFDPHSEVRLCLNLPDRIVEVYEQIWVGKHEGRPVINAALDPRGSCVYVGCILQERVNRVHRRRVDLGRYQSEEDAAKVRDFYVVHQGLEEPLNFPDFDYDKWIPPKTTSGQYNEHIAEILRKKLLQD